MRPLGVCGMILFLGGWACADNGASKGYPPAATFDTLTSELRSRLPQGWSVAYDPEYKVLTITRQREALCDPIVINGSGDEKPENVRLEFALEIVPFVSAGKYRVLAAQNQDIQKQLDAMEKRLGVAGKGGTYFDNGRSDPAEIKYYNGLKATLHDLPDLRYHDISLKWIPVNPDSWGLYPDVPVDDTVKRECQAVIKKIEGTLEKY